MYNIETSLKHSHAQECLMRCRSDANAVQLEKK
jgi:hypothetical protein